MNLLFATNNAHKLDEARRILGSSVKVIALRDLLPDVTDLPETGQTLEENALQKAQYVADCIALRAGGKRKEERGKRIVLQDEVQQENVLQDEVQQENTSLSSRTKCETAIVADDTGLFVDALDGQPGVHTARFDEHSDHDSQANMRKLLRLLYGTAQRTARFQTVVALIEPGQSAPKLFRGVVEGRIVGAPRGSHGFGYDPVFQPEGYAETFAELPAEVKNDISHRARAFGKLAEYLSSL